MLHDQGVEMLNFFKKLTFFKKVTAFFMGAVLLGGGTIVFGSLGATTASAVTFSTATHATGQNFPGGPGHSGTVWAGTYNNGKRGFCLDFGKATPNRKGTDVITGNVPGMNAEESKRAKYIANKYDNNGSPEAAANAGFAIWRLQHDGNFNTWYGAAYSKKVITVARHNAINAILDDAAQHSTYKMSVTTTEVYVGQRGSGTVKVLGSNGRPAANRQVTVTSAQGRILTGSKGTTGSNGLMGFTYQRNTTGTITFKATLVTDSSKTAGVSISSAGHQRTLSGGYMENAVATTDYDKKVLGPDIVSKCDSDCNGKSTVTFRFTNHSGIQALKWTMKFGNNTETLSAKPSGTVTKVLHLDDGTIINGSSYCYTGSVVGGGCTTPWVNVSVNREIVCPAWALGELTLPCNCTPGLPGSVSMTSPASSPRFYRGFVSINKGAPTEVNLVNGKPATINTGKLGAGTNVVIRFTAYRDAAHTLPLSSYVLRDITVN